MKLFKEREPDVRFACDKDILKGIDNKPDNSLIYYIGNYPTKEILEKVDLYMRHMKPPSNMWDAVLNTGNSKEVGSGYASTGFASKYKEYLVENEKAYAELLHTKARSLVRPIYIGHHPSKKMYSPAQVCINMIEHYVELPSEVNTERVVTYTGHH